MDYIYDVRTIYLDHCCYNRPFDDHSIPKNRVEAEAVLSLLEMVEDGQVRLIGSEVLDLERRKMRDRRRQWRVEQLTHRASAHIAVGEVENVVIWFEEMIDT